MKYQDLRIMQLIDSLEAGGAERMSVNYANALSSKIGFSGLVSTRKKGILENTIYEKVVFEFLERKKFFDVNAFFRLRKYVKRHRVTHIQAHSTSFFLASIIKITCPSLKIIWHDHYGDSEFLKKRPKLVLQICSLFFTQIIAVNTKLVNWSRKILWCNEVYYLPNFVQLNKTGEKKALKGVLGKRIVCLANLRPQKNHFFLLQIAKEIVKPYPDWTFHLVGKDFEDDYSKRLKEQIEVDGLTDNVFLYGTIENIASVLEEATIIVLTSNSEGLPVSILEAGCSKKTSCSYSCWRNS